MRSIPAHPGFNGQRAGPRLGQKCGDGQCRHRVMPRAVPHRMHGQRLLRNTFIQNVGIFHVRSIPVHLARFGVERMLTAVAANRDEHCRPRFMPCDLRCRTNGRLLHRDVLNQADSRGGSDENCLRTGLRRG